MTETSTTPGFRYAALCVRALGPLSPRSCIANLVSRGLIPLSSPLVPAAQRADTKAEIALRAVDVAIGRDIGLVRDVCIFDQEPAVARIATLASALDRLRQYWNGAPRVIGARG